MATKQCACTYTELYTLKRLNGKFNVYFTDVKKEEDVTSLHLSVRCRGTSRSLDGKPHDGNSHTRLLCEW